MKEKKKKTILVPTDLTSVTEAALDHAIEIANLFKREVVMLHILTRKRSSDEDVKMKLEQKASKLNEDTDVEVSFIIKKGSIFTTISEVAVDIDAEFIIMGIHGKKGLQYIVGSYAYRVITSSKTPVMVVKKKHSHRGYDNIVLPIDFSHESTQKVKKAIKFAKYFNATLRIIGFLATKSYVWKIKKEVILQKVTDHIKQSGVNVTADLIVQPGAVVHDVVLDYAEKVNADMIMIVAETGDRFSDIFSRNSAEKIVDKSNFPVLTIIPDWLKDDDEDDDISTNTVFKPFIDPLGLLKEDRF